MITVKAARATLAGSIFLYAVALVGMAAELINPGVGLLASLAAIFGMFVSSIACLFFWAKGRFRGS
jgi:hypothetical protein